MGSEVLRRALTREGHHGGHGRARPLLGEGARAPRLHGLVLHRDARGEADEAVLRIHVRPGGRDSVRVDAAMEGLERAARAARSSPLLARTSTGSVDSTA